MSGLSVTEIVDLSVLLVAHEERARLIDLPGRLSDLSGGWFAPCTDVVAGRVGALEAAGCVRLEGGGLRPHRRLRVTPDGLDYARALGGKAAPRPCAAAVLWRNLRLSLRGLLEPEVRSNVLLGMAHRDAGLPAMTALARDLTGAGQRCGT